MKLSKIFARLGRRVARRAVKPINAQAVPVPCGPEGAVARDRVKIDGAYWFEGRVVLLGWITGDATIGLRIGDADLRTVQRRLARPDVAKHFSLADGANLGFLMVAEAADGNGLRLTWRHGDADAKASAPIKVAALNDSIVSDTAGLRAAFEQVLGGTDPGTDLIAHLSRTAVLSADVTTGPGMAGAIDGAACCSESGLTVVWGWTVLRPDADSWIEDESGTRHALKPERTFRLFRRDVQEAATRMFPQARSDHGFVALLRTGAPGASVQLKAARDGATKLLAQAQVGTIGSDPVTAARFLFSIPTSVAEFARRAQLIDSPILDPLIEARNALWTPRADHVRVLGSMPTTPRVSVIVPLYGRLDFVEHQLMEFCRDPWFAQHAELIYVLDDPNLFESLKYEAEALHRLYPVPFSWIAGATNRGFAGANNLGAAHARAPFLLFLNSDAFPQKPGWIEPLLAALEVRPELGAVGPRLVYPDGSIQHAGMSFMRLDEQGIWINHHPNQGQAASLDPARGLTVLPSITGACMAMRRSAFDQVGGWDCGYLIGDFEDSDLCLKLRDKGLKIGYLPDVELVHLERQTFNMLGHDDFRIRVTFLNASRHQRRWERLITQAVTA